MVQVLKGLAAGLVLLPIGAANAVMSIDFVDHTVHKRAMDDFNQAADFDEDIRVRRGEQQFRSSIAATKLRMDESRKRLEAIGEHIKNNRW